MIQIEILKSPYPDLVGKHQWFKNQLYFGGKSGDVILFEEKYSSNSLMIEVIGTELYVHPGPELDFYLHNGKRATKIRKFNLFETITVGQTSFRIMLAEEDTIFAKNEALKNKFNEIKKNNPPLFKIIYELSQ
jgi:hypothetical protein